MPQYLIWAGRVMRADLGNTILSERPVSKVVMERLPNTLVLGISAWTFATVIGIPLGILSAVKRGTFWDYFDAASPSSVRPYPSSGSASSLS